MIAPRLRLILATELVAYYFAAPYIILLGLDEYRGLLDSTYSMNVRLCVYALLIGFYPLLQIIISPFVGRQLDQRQSKITVLRKIHLANAACYLFLGLSAWQHNLLFALVGLCIPGFVGCASPVGKSLIASITLPEARVKEFALLAFIKGLVKLTAPLLGAFVFQQFIGEAGYGPLFVVSSVLSFSCFLYSFSFPHITLSSETPKCKSEVSLRALFSHIVKNNYPLLIVFVLLLTGYTVFVKYTPLLIFEKLGEHPSLVNYFASLVGLAFACNQFVVMRFSKRIESLIAVIFTILCISTICLIFTQVSPVWFVGLFGILFCFSVLATCVEARLSLQGAVGTQGTVQGILYSVENWSLLLSPIIGSLVAALSTVYPLYFVTFCALFSALFFAYSQIHLKRFSSESSIKTR